MIVVWQGGVLLSYSLQVIVINNEKIIECSVTKEQGTIFFKSQV
jgi:hypothetical protein